MLQSVNSDLAARGKGLKGLKGSLSAARRTLGSVKVLMSSGLHRTSAGDLSAKVFRKHAAGIRAYLTVRMRDAALARRAYRDAWDELENARVSDIKKAPSRAAHMYLLARNIAEYARLFDDDFEERSIDATPWEPAPPGSVERYGDVLDQLRHTISEEELEMLELHHVRDLSIGGVAHVLGIREEDAQRRVSAATAFARMLVEDELKDPPPIKEVLRDCLRVLPPPPDEEDPVTSNVPRPLPPGTVVGRRYTVEEKVGGGAFGWVYRATDVKVPGHVVALKMLHKAARTEAAREGAIRELSLIASAFHPSLVQFKDHGWWEERLWFVMPWYEGETLEQRISDRPLSPEDAWEIFEPVARALAALHAAGIRHQDIKPDNIFLARTRTGLGAGPSDVLPVLLDLGVAAPAGDMAVAGTPMYFAPEVAARFVDASHDVPVTDKADVFALALSILHAVEPPDAELAASRDFEGFVRERSEGVPDLPKGAALSAARVRFEQWLHRDPVKRPTAAQLADELHTLALRGRTGGTVVTDAGPVSSMTRSRRPSFASLMFALVGLVALGGAAAYGSLVPAGDPAAAVAAAFGASAAPATSAPSEAPAPTEGEASRPGADPGGAASGEEAPAAAEPREAPPTSDLERRLRVVTEQLETARERAAELERELSGVRSERFFGNDARATVGQDADDDTPVDDG